MMRWLFPASCLGILVLAVVLLQFVSNSPVATAKIGANVAPETALHFHSGQQLYPLRLSARVAGSYQGDASLMLIGNLSAEMTLINIGALLSPLAKQAYSLDGGHLLNLGPGSEIDLLVLLQRSGATPGSAPEQAAQVPSCCQLPPGQAIDGQTTAGIEPALVLMDEATATTLWTIPLRMDLTEKQTPNI